MAIRRYTLTATTGSDNKTIYEPNSTDQWIYTWDGLAGTDRLSFDRLTRSQFSITKDSAGAIHVDSVSSASHIIAVTLTNVEKLSFNSGRDIVDLVAMFGGATNTAPSGAVSIIGTARQGQTLIASNTLADVDGLGQITYTWKAAGVIVGAGSSLVLTQAHVGKAITVTASYTDAGGTGESVTSSATTAVANVNDVPTGAVTIRGEPLEGQTLIASNTLADADGLGQITYTWKAAGVALGNGDSLVLTQAQVGKAITVTATYTDLQGTPETVTSGATAIVVNVNDPVSGSVAITGQAWQGKILSAAASLSDPDGLPESDFDYQYQWFAGSAAIEGATSLTLQLSPDLVGSAISVRVSFIDRGGSLESLISDPTASVVSA